MFMSRRIDTGPPIEHLDGVPSEHGKTLTLGRREDYLGRLVKYIPSEIIALYIFTSGMVQPRPDGTTNWKALWIVFAINFAFVPPYLIFATSRGKKKVLWPQVLLSCVAFPVWVFALGGPFKYWKIDNWIPAVTLAFVTVALGFYKPRPGS